MSAANDSAAITFTSQRNLPIKLRATHWVNEHPVFDDLQNTFILWHCQIYKTTKVTSIKCCGDCFDRHQNSCLNLQC